MTDTRSAEVPTLSLADQDRDPEGFAAALGQSFERFGFAIVADHGVPADLIDRAWTQTKALFDLPEDEKRAYHVPGGGGARGPVQDRNRQGCQGRRPEGILARRPRAARGPPLCRPDARQYLARPARGFREDFVELFSAFDRAGDRLLSAIARHLKLEPNWFDPAVKDGNSVLRLLHYPPIPADAEGVRAGAHEDINLITLLLGPRKRGWNCSTAIRVNGWPSVRPRARWWSMSATCCSG